MTTDRSTTYLAGANLLLPGAGIILLGRAWAGLAAGLAFGLCANYALWAMLLVPDELPAWARALGVGLGCGTYLGAQVRFWQTVRAVQQEQDAVVRRAALAAAQTHLRDGSPGLALTALEPVRDWADTDLLIAFRLAQIHTRLGDAEAAGDAWTLVRILDPHGIYREEIRKGEETVRRLGSADDTRLGRAASQP